LETRPGYVKAAMRGYELVVDAERMVLAHDCEDWRKGVETKRLCKHFTKLFMVLPEDIATPILRSLSKEAVNWSFEFLDRDNAAVTA